MSEQYANRRFCSNRGWSRPGVQVARCEGPLQRTTENREQDTSLYRISSFAFSQTQLWFSSLQSYLPNFKVFDSFRHQLWFSLNVYQLLFCWHLFCEQHQRKGKASILSVTTFQKLNKILRILYLILELVVKILCLNCGRSMF